MNRKKLNISGWHSMLEEKYHNANIQLIPSNFGQINTYFSSQWRYYRSNLQQYILDWWPMNPKGVC